MYIDVFFPRPSSTPYLNILVDRQSNYTGLHTFFTALVPQLTKSRDTKEEGDGITDALSIIL
jgi:hypothetical protein